MPGWGEPHGPEPLHGRALLDELGPILEPVRRLRFESSTSFGDVGDDDLERAARSLHAIAYSATEGARLLERVAAGRRADGNPVDSAAGEGTK